MVEVSASGGAVGFGVAVPWDPDRDGVGVLWPVVDELALGCGDVVLVLVVDGRVDVAEEAAEEGVLAVGWPPAGSPSGVLHPTSASEHTAATAGYPAHPSDEPHVTSPLKW